MEPDPLKSWLRRRGWLEPGGFLSRPGGALVLTLACAALLLALGYEACQSALGPSLEAARRELAEQTSRANRLAQENQQLEARLALATAQLETGDGLGRSPSSGLGDSRPDRLRELHRGETLTLLEGKVSLTLQTILASPSRALLRLKTPGTQELEAALRPGQELPFKLGRQPWRLVLHRIHPASIAFALLSDGA